MRQVARQYKGFQARYSRIAAPREAAEVYAELRYGSSGSDRRSVAQVTGSRPLRRQATKIRMITESSVLFAS